MIHTGTNNRQANGNIDPGFQPENFYRRVPLVVVHRHHNVEVAPRRAVEQRIGRERSHDLNPLLLGPQDSRNHLLLFLAVAKQAIFPRVRVNSADGDPGRSDARFFQRLVGQGYHLVHPLRINHPDCIEDADMRGHMNHTQLGGREHHRIVLGIRQLGQNLGVARVEMAPFVQGFLVQRGSADRIDFLCFRQLNRPLQETKSGIACLGRYLSKRQIGGEQVEIETIDSPPLEYSRLDFLYRTNRQ